MKTSQILKQLQDEGKSYNAISVITGLSKATISYHLGPGQKKKASLRRKKRKNVNKEELVKFKGGKCMNCGYNKCMAALEFHHRDPLQKEFSIAHIKGHSMEFIKKELEKCDLLCSNCHKEVHYCTTIPLLA